MNLDAVIVFFLTSYSALSEKITLITAGTYGGVHKFPLQN